MNYKLTTKHIDISDQDRDMMDEKFGRLEKHLTVPFRLEVMLQHDTHHRHGDVVTCRLNVNQFGTTLHAERSRDSVQNAVDESVDALKRELIKHKEKDQDKRRS